VNRPTGLLSLEDFADAEYQAEIEEPLRGEYHGLTVHKCGPWTQGPVLRQRPEPAGVPRPGRYGTHSAKYIHTVVECVKLAHAGGF